MYHCTLLYSTDLDRLNAALSGKMDAEDLLPGSRVVRAVPSVRSEVANISEFLSPAIPLKRFMLLLFHFFMEEEGDIYRFTNEDLKAIERLKQEKYASGEWIYNKASFSFA